MSASRFAYFALNAVRVFSSESGIATMNNNTVGLLIDDSIEGLYLVVEYTWPADRTDLDTSTSFLEDTAGFGCGSAGAYLQFSGDNVAGGGTEQVRVNLGDSFADGRWSSEVNVELNAGWYGSFNKGPATVNVYTARQTTDNFENQRAISFVVTPGTQSGCSSTNVGAASIAIADGGAVIIQIAVL